MQNRTFSTTTSTVNYVHSSPMLVKIKVKEMHSGTA